MAVLLSILVVAGVVGAIFRGALNGLALCIREWFAGKAALERARRPSK